MAKNEDNPAKLAILQEWDFWAKEHPEAASLSGGPSFFRIPEKSPTRFAYGFQGIRRQVENRAFMVASCAESEGLKVAVGFGENRR